MDLLYRKEMIVQKKNALPATYQAIYEQIDANKDGVL